MKIKSRNKAESIQEPNQGYESFVVFLTSKESHKINSRNFKYP